MTEQQTSPSKLSAKAKTDRKQIGNFMICFFVGMAYFNLFSTLNADQSIPPIVLTLSASAPIVLALFWKLWVNKTPKDLGKDDRPPSSEL